MSAVRPLMLAAVALIPSSAAAGPDEPPVHFEVGLNARHFGASDRPQAAFRTATGAMIEQGTPGGSGVTVGLRFTKWMRWNLFSGIELETGTLTEPSSNVAGAYGLAGMRHRVGPLAVSAELAPGKRWVRYELYGKDHERYMMETRVRAETWLSPRLTVGGAVGATVTGDTSVWMAGAYIGIHSLDFGTR